MPYQPILEDPLQVASLAGQRFVVLRAPAEVASAWRVLQQGLRDRLVGKPVFYPATPHLTLCGFPNGTSTDALRAVTMEWSIDVPPLRFEVERIDAFPPPAQIVSVAVRKTSELTAALVRLRALAERHGLSASTAVPVDQWTPRMSLVYGGRLDLPAWRELQAMTQGLVWLTVAGTVSAAEVLTFDDGGERPGGECVLGG